MTEKVVLEVAVKTTPLTSDEGPHLLKREK